MTLSRKGVDTRAHGAKVPFAAVDAIDCNILTMLRSGRGYRDHEYLLLMVRRATATRRRQAA